jgi:hypothetical protein
MTPQYISHEFSENEVIIMTETTDPIEGTGESRSPAKQVKYQHQVLRDQDG